LERARKLARGLHRRDPSGLGGVGKLARSREGIELGCSSALAAANFACNSSTLAAAFALASVARSFCLSETAEASAFSATANCSSILRLRFSETRIAILACAASREAVTAACFAVAALLAASSASAARTAARASAPGFGMNRAGWAISMGVTSVGATITRIPSRVRSNKRAAKSYGSRMQPWDAGYPGSGPPWSAMPDQVMRCMWGMYASS